MIANGRFSTLKVIRNCLTMPAAMRLNFPCLHQQESFLAYIPLTMDQVAAHLEEQSLKSNDPNTADLFGRSSFNRFYYSAYWAIRGGLSAIEPSISKQNHKDIPTYLSNSIQKKLISHCKKSAAEKVLTEGDLRRIKSEIRTAITNISNSIERAYAIRCIADYEPDKKAQAIGRKVEMDGVSLSAMKHYDSTIKTSVLKILKKCDEIGIVR